MFKFVWPFSGQQAIRVKTELPNSWLVMLINIYFPLETILEIFFIFHNWRVEQRFGYPKCFFWKKKKTKQTLINFSPVLHSTLGWYGLNKIFTRKRCSHRCDNYKNYPCWILRENITRNWWSNSFKLCHVSSYTWINISLYLISVSESTIIKTHVYATTLSNIFMPGISSWTKNIRCNR